MIWLASHFWILMIAALYVAWWVYAIRDFIRWQRCYFDTSSFCPFGGIFIATIIVHIVGLFILSIGLYIKVYS